MGFGTSRPQSPLPDVHSRSQEWMAGGLGRGPRSRKAGGGFGGGWNRSIKGWPYLSGLPPRVPRPAHRPAVPGGRGRNAVRSGDRHSAALGERYSCMVLKAEAQPPRSHGVGRPGVGDYSPAPLRPGSPAADAAADLEEVPRPPRPVWGCGV